MILNQKWLYFLKSAELLSYSRAAKTLNISQGAISQAIQKLEEECGVQLFDRSPGKSELEITPAGQTIYEELISLEPRFLNETLPKVKGMEKPLRIACVSHISGRHLLPILKSRNGLNYHIYIIPRRNYILQGLKRNHFDLTIYSGPVTDQTQDVFCDELYYYVGLKKQFKFIEKITSNLQLKSMANLYDRKPFENKWSNFINSDRSGFFLDDHFTGRELILNGHGLSSYSLYYFSLSELKKLAISPAKVDHPIVHDKWKIQSAYLSANLTPKKKEAIEALIAALKKSLLLENSRISSILKKKWSTL